MKSSKNIIMIILMLIALCRQAFAQNAKLDSIYRLEQFEELAQKGHWEVVKQKKGVTLSYRKLKVADTLDIRELSASFTILSTVGHIIEHVKQPLRMQEWNEGVRHSELLENQDSTWVSHITFDIPYPFPQQELIARYDVDRDRERVTISTRSVPNYKDLKKGVNREKYNWGRWSLYPKDNGSVQVTFTVISLSNSNIPRFIKDPIIKRKLINSFINLKDKLSGPVLFKPGS
ncbi:hypothetical protein [Flagellimonas algicola]|uniref:START domain-containing protein n=1 Tax=Flagellimonas algicola TaxID=2583815 RepID=A0ABY2WFT6_9FLAO|nr:hypothetical protein [Allomuricauda algicola]TMU50390.1 hypothetical protein FGG15_19780 [Allomuricauda algicola]